MTEKFWWYAARSTGIVAWALLTIAVLWGLFLSTRILQQRRKPPLLLDLHRFLGGLAVSFTILHLSTLPMDRYVHFGWREMFIPGVSERPAAVYGITAFYLMVAVQVTSLAMKRLPRKMWKAVHLSSFGLFWLASIHAALAGSDTSTRWYQITAFGVIMVVVFTSAYRFIAERKSRRTPPLPRTPTRA